MSNWAWNAVTPGMGLPDYIALENQRMKLLQGALLQKQAVTGELDVQTDFGAKGNAASDDTTAFQNGITEAISSGKRLRVPGVQKFYKVTASLTATLNDCESLVMQGDGIRSLIYSTAPGDILTVDGKGSVAGKTQPFLSDFVVAGSSATQDGIVLDYTHRGVLSNVFIIGCGRWAWNYKGCFLNKMFGGGGSINLGAIGNIPTQPVPRGMLKLGDGTGGGGSGSNENSFFGSCFEGSEKAATNITGATNATPIVIEAVAHGLSTGAVVGVTGITGNTAANGAWSVTKVDADHFSLDTSVGNGAFVAGGTVREGVGIYIQATTNSYGNTFMVGTAENNSVGCLIGPNCTLNSFYTTDITSNVVVDFKDRGSLNSFINSGTGSGVASFGGGLNAYGPFQIIGSSAFVQLDPTYGLRINKNDASHTVLRALDNRDVIVGDGAIATNATGGFLHMSGGAGAPSGTPANAAAGVVPVYYDTTNNFLYVYNGGWKKSTVYA